MRKLLLRRSGGTVLVLLLAGAMLMLLAPVMAQAAISHLYTGHSFGPGGVGSGAFGANQSIAVNDATGDVYVFDAETGALDKFTESGEPAAFSAVSADAIEGITGAGFTENQIAVDNSNGPAKGDIYVANPRIGVRIFAEDGEALGELTSAVEGLGGVWGETCGVAVDAAGHVYVSVFGSGVDRYTPTGNPVSDLNFTPPVLEDAGFVCNVAVDSQESIYTAAYSGGQITKYEAQLAGSPFSTGNALAVDHSTDDVYVDQGSGVAQYASSGALGGVFAVSGSGALEEGSAAIAVDGSSGKPSSGQIYVASGGVVEIFGPAVVLPDVTTGEAEQEGAEETLHGSVNPDEVNVSSCEFEYGVSTVSEHTASCSSLPGAGNVLVGVSASLTGLQPVSEYHYRIAAGNGNGTSRGAEASFVSAGPPSIGSVASTGVTSTSATLTAQVNPNGVGTHYYFLYGTANCKTSPASCTSVPSPPGTDIGAGTTVHDVSVQLQDLLAGTTYHFSVVATNSLGTSDVFDETLTTKGGDCPNESIRAAQGPEVVALPDCIALEQVSPPRKGNQLAREPDLISADGKRVVFRSLAALDPITPQYEGFGGDLYVASRGEGSGWITEGANVPYGTDGTVGGRVQVSFTPELSSWLQVVTLSEGSQEFLREGPGHSAAALSPPLKNRTSNISGASFQGASSDQSHVYFVSEGGVQSSYLPDDPLPEGVGEDTNLYVAHLGSGGEPTLELLARDRDGKAWGASCGARLGGMEPTTGHPLNLRNGERNQGAIAPDGSRVFFSTRPAQPANGVCTEANKKRIMVREETPTGPGITELFQSECTRISPACATTDGDDAYQGASLDQSKVYFTTSRQLTNSDLDSGAECSIEAAEAGCDLYLYDATRPAGERLIQVSAGETDAQHEAGKEAKVYNSIAAISADGSRVYFVAQSALTEHPNPAGAVAEAGKPDLYTWDANTAKLSFIATVSPGDQGELWGSGGGTWSNGAYPVPIAGTDAGGHETGGNGHILLFKSKASLTANDADGGFMDVYRYNADTEELACISCHPGGPDKEPFEADPRFGSGSTAPGNDYANVDRPISEDGQTIEFTSLEGLLPGESSGVENVYLSRGGHVYHLPGSARAVNTRSNAPSLSLDGSMLAYATVQPLLPSDGDSASDVYVARVDGGYPEPEPAEPCVGEACQQHSSQPAGNGAASETFAGLGNVSPVQQPPSKPVVKPKTLTRAQMLAKAVKTCRKKARRQRSACEKRARKRYGARAKRKKHTGKNKTSKSSGKGNR